MIVNLRNGKARLSELVEVASQGEDVLITVRGKVKARLTRALPEPSRSDRNDWVEELRAHLARQASRPAGTMQQVLDEVRQDRL